MMSTHPALRRGVATVHSPPEVPMFRRIFAPLAVVLVAVACSDRDPVTLTPPPDAATAPVANSAREARERLAERLAAALADPSLRAEFARRFATSDAPEG